jgi:hypothetical protein
MKNQNQAEVKTNNRQSHTPSQKRRGRQLLTPSTTQGAISTDDPFQLGSSFEIVLDWIGNTMEPEVSQGNLAAITKREDMDPCTGEMVVGLLKTGHLVFGAHEREGHGFCRISFINPKYVPVYYPEKEFQWLYPVEFISILGTSEPHYREIIKTLEFHYGDY